MIIKKSYYYKRNFEKKKGVGGNCSPPAPLALPLLASRVHVMLRQIYFLFYIYNIKKLYCFMRLNNFF